MKIGSKVKNIVVIQSDDREHGLNDGTPIIPVGTSGIVVAYSKDNLLGNTKLKPGTEDSLLVEFYPTNGIIWRYDVSPSEIKEIKEIKEIGETE